MQRRVPIRIYHADAAARAHQYLGHLDVAGPVEGSLPIDVSPCGLVPLQGFPNHNRIAELGHGVKVVLLLHPFPAPSSATSSPTASPSSLLSLLPSGLCPPPSSHSPLCPSGPPPSPLLLHEACSQMGQILPFSHQDQISTTFCPPQSFPASAHRTQDFIRRLIFPLTFWRDYTADFPLRLEAQNLKIHTSQHRAFGQQKGCCWGTVSSEEDGGTVEWGRVNGCTPGIRVEQCLCGVWTPVGLEGGEGRGTGRGEERGGEQRGISLCREEGWCAHSWRNGSTALTTRRRGRLLAGSHSPWSTAGEESNSENPPPQERERERERERVSTIQCMNLKPRPLQIKHQGVGVPLPGLHCLQRGVEIDGVSDPKRRIPGLFSSGVGPSNGPSSPSSSSSSFSSSPSSFNL
jgi:hypothetical protein